MTDRIETFLGIRYLRYHRSSPTVARLTIFFFLLSLTAVIATSALHKDLTFVAVSLPIEVLFIVFLLLNFFSVFTTVSIVGVILGVAALTVVLSVTSGFQEVFRAKVLGVNAHVTVLKYGIDFSEYPEVMKKLEKMPHVKAVSPFVFEEMMLAHGSSLSGVLVKGIDPAASAKVLDLEKQLESGKMGDLEVLAPASGGDKPIPGIFLGHELQKKLKVKLGDAVRLVMPKPNLDPMAWAPAGGGEASNGPTSRDFRLVGVFHAGFDEYDRHLAYLSLKSAQAFSPSGDVVTGVEMRIDDLDHTTEICDDISERLGGSPYRVLGWEELNHNLFEALRLQKIALLIFLTLIILVAAFNIVAALTMMVIDKTKEVAILKSMGMRSSGAARMFQVVGLTIGAVGTTAGVGLGLFICFAVRHFGYQLDPNVYLIEHLPVRVSISEIALTCGITIGICFLATLYPAIKASRLQPVEGLRYE